jgi:hypothetical protein
MFRHKPTGVFIMQAWTIKQLYEAMQNDLTMCHTNFERSMVKAISGKEIREKATEWAKQRKLTPMEVAIAQEFGYKG